MTSTTLLQPQSYLLLVLGEGDAPKIQQAQLQEIGKGVRVAMVASWGVCVLGDGDGMILDDCVHQFRFCPSRVDGMILDGLMPSLMFLFIAPRHR